MKQRFVRNQSDLLLYMRVTFTKILEIFTFYQHLLFVSLQFCQLDRIADNDKNNNIWSVKLTAHRSKTHNGHPMAPKRSVKTFTGSLETFIDSHDSHSLCAHQYYYKASDSNIVLKNNSNIRHHYLSSID